MKEVITIPTNKILPAGRTLGIEPNRLSEVSGFPDITGTTKVEREWEALLPTLLAPGKVSMLMKGNRDQAIELSSLSSGDGKILMYSGKADGNTHIRTLEPKQFREELMAVMATNIPGKDIARPMSLDALFVLAALSDFIKRQKAQIMLGLTQEPTPPTLSEIQSLLDKAENTMEARWWLTPFLYHIYGLRRKIVVSDAVTQLQTFELVAENEGNVYPTEAGFILLDQLTFRRGIVGFHSFYFEEGKPVQSTQVL
ncbi:MAG TPA: hypothetical protein DDZ44_05525, partial [Syntrophomonas wolfei]|nr:hypothetical protein [Syntrophomonas wolfei]